LISGRPSRVRWRGRPTASDELLGPGSSRDARRGRASVRSIGWADLGPDRCAVTKRGPHEGTHRAHHLPGLAPSAIISAGGTGEPRVRDGQDFFRPRNPSLSGQRFLPDFAHLGRGGAAGCFRDPILIQDDRATDAGGLRRYKACAGRTYSRAARPGRRDRVRALRCGREPEALSLLSSSSRVRATPRLAIAVCGHAAVGALRPFRESTRRLPAICDQDRSALPLSNAAPNRPAQ
jgi:hypothetical protein